MNTLFSFFVWIMWVLHLLILGPIGVLALAINRQLGFKFLKFFSWSAMSVAGIHVKVIGAEKVDWNKSYVFMGNHQNMLEPFIFIMAIPRHMVGVEKKENLKIPVYGWLTRLWGNVHIDRENRESALASIDEATETLRNGMSIIILPEGTRSKTGEIGPFKKGGFHMAINTGAAIVPFTFNGGYRRFRGGSLRVHPGTVEVVFDNPIATEGYTRESLDELIAKVRDVICSNYKGP